MLKAVDLSFRYAKDKPWVWQGVNLEVEPGEVVGLSGPSGLGKTTLAKILAGYLPTHTGQVTLDDKPLPKAGYCPVQLIFQHPELAVNPRWRISRVLYEGHRPDESLLHSLGVSQGWLSRWPQELSGGELQRVAVARALGPQTRYLIADEMTTMLDANTQALIWQAVLAHAQKHNIGVLVVSHDAPLLKRLCERVISLEAVMS